jgi:hypothetical protein
MYVYASRDSAQTQTVDPSHSFTSQLQTPPLTPVTAPAQLGHLLNYVNAAVDEDTGSADKQSNAIHDHLAADFGKFCDDDWQHAPAVLIEDSQNSRAWSSLLFDNAQQQQQQPSGAI